MQRMKIRVEKQNRTTNKHKKLSIGIDNAGSVYIESYVLEAE